ncbi:hypothetical protein D3C81_1216460 [compost metagenome]
MTVGPDFPTRTGLAYQGIVRRNAAIRVQAHHLALQLAEILGRGTLVVLAQRDEQIAGPVEHQPRTEMGAGGELGLLAEDHLEILQRAQVGRQPPPPDRRTGVTVRPRLGIAQVDQAIGGELRRQDDIQQAALPLGVDRRHPGQRRRPHALGRHPAQTSAALGHQHALPVRQESQCPGMLQPADQLVQFQRAVRAAQRWRGLRRLQQAGAQQERTAAQQGQGPHRDSPAVQSAGAGKASCSSRNSASTRALFNCSSRAAYSRVSVPWRARSSSGRHCAGSVASSAR